MYDFRNLSPHDLECLVRDLLQNRYRIHVESFATGRDQGIDLRFTRCGKGVVVQCKHYINSDFRPLRDHLKTRELPKLAKLTPKRYILATSGVSVSTRTSRSRLP